jgi:hypothetical protein
MTRKKQVSQNHEKKGEIPDAFIRILTMQANFLIHPYDRYSTEGLRKERKEAKEELRAFWDKRKGSDYRKLFDGPYNWSEQCAFAGIEIECGQGQYRRIEQYYPGKDVMQLFVILNERFHSRKWIKDIFEKIDWDLDFRMNRAQLVRMLHPDSLTRLIYSLDGSQIAELLDAAGEFERGRHFSERKDFEKEGLVEKISLTLSGNPFNRLDRLGYHLALDPFSIQTLRTLQENGGKISRDIVDQLITNLKKLHENLQQTLDYFRGGQ